MLMQIW